MIQTIPVEDKHMVNLRERGFTADTVYSINNILYEDVKTKLLEIGGEAVILIVAIERICPNILTDGQLFTDKVSYAKNTTKYHGFWLHEKGLWRFGDFQVTKDGKVVGVDDELAFFGVPVN